MRQAQDIQIPKHIRQRAQAAKRYIQKKYSLNQIKAQQKAENWKQFQQRLKILQLSSSQQQNIKNQVLHQQMNQCRRKRQKISKKNFQSLAIIGRGAFGEVRLCKQIKTGRIVAIKCLKKKQMIKKNQQTHLRDQRDILADGSQWIVKLLYSFQDQVNLYLVMQFLPGGDLMTLLIQRNVITQNQSRFYVAQTMIALESVHKLNFIHRDLKPDNILIDPQGNIKLSDFGLCKQTDQISNDYLDNIHLNRKPDLKIMKRQRSKIDHLKMIDLKRRNRKLAYSAVGTPDYIAPQMLSRKGYTQTVDWWSLGIMLYEMLIGYAPFTADTNQQIYYKIQNHQQFLHFPAQVDLSEEVIDLISRLLTKDSIRLGKNGVIQIQRHPWFRGINWFDVKKLVPPFVPQVKNETDIRYFDKYQQKELWVYNPLDPNYKKDFNFIGYTFKDQEQQKNQNIYEKALHKAQQQKQQQLRRQKQMMDLMKTNMKKKKNFHVDLSKYQKDKNIDKTFCINTNKSQLHTQRSKQLKSKSPLNERDSNLAKKKVSKSPVQSARRNQTMVTQKSTSYLKKQPQLTYSSTIFHQTQVTGRKSLNGRK